jgi:hypothetical protein
MKETDEFAIPPAPWQEVERSIEALATQTAVKISGQGGRGEVRLELQETILKGMADIATNAWKAKAKMLDNAGEVRDEMKRVFRHIEGVLDSLHEMGLEVKDHTGDAFDYGLPLKVVTTQPTPGITRESVIETIRPTIYWQQQIIQKGEVVIATPA